MRKLPALIVVAALVGSLTACSAASAPGSAGCTTPASGNASSVVSVKGEFGQKPVSADIPTPINTSRTEVSTLIKGHGQTLVTGTPTFIKYTVYSGTTGKVVSSSSYGTPTTPITVGAKNGGPIVDGLVCATVGSRLAIAVKASDLTSTTGKSTPGSGPAYVAVVDVVKAFLPKADGALQPGVNDMPAIVTAANGTPGVSIPDIAAPESQKVQWIRKGSGAKLTSSSTAIVQFTAVDWSHPSKVEGSTWTGSNGQAATALPLNSSQIPGAIRSALVGKTVGSQVMVVLPAKTTGTATALVYVFDVLGSF